MHHSEPIAVTEVTAATEHDGSAHDATTRRDATAAITRLLQQLSPTRMPFGYEQLEAIIAQPNVFLWLAGDSEFIGMITLVTIRTPGGFHARIEDLVVVEDARGRGVGERLLRVAVERAGKLGAAHVDLTSRPTREAARRLYARLGFVQRDTAVFRLNIDSAGSELP